MEFIAFCDLHGGPEAVLNRVSERSARVASVGEKAGDVVEIVAGAIQGSQGAVAVGDVGCGEGDGMR